jgi:hypothetical protein
VPGALFSRSTRHLGWRSARAGRHLFVEVDERRLSA